MQAIDRREPSGLGIAWLSIALALACGCSGGSDKRHEEPDDPNDLDGPNAENVPNEVLENASGRVDETEIRAAIVGDDIEVLLPLERIGSGTLRGEAGVTLRDALTDQARGSDRADVEQTTTHAQHRLVIAGAGAGLLRADAAKSVLAWRFELPDGVLQGRRSLYAALGQLTVQVRGPNTLPTIGASPLRVLVHDADSGKAVRDAEVTVTLTPADDAGDEHELFAGKTDAAGEHLGQMELPAGIDMGRVRVDVRSEDAHVWTYLDVQRTSEQQGVYLSSDKTIYQPGQTVALRALALTSDTRAPIADSEAVFEARDGKGNKVFRKRVNTDEFGVAAAEVPTDVRVNEGDWVFSVTVAGSRQELAIPVNRYNLPKMNVHVAPEASFAMPGDTISGSVDAFYVFGEPVASAQVAIDVRAGGQSLAPLTGTTDAQGRFAFSLTVPATLAVPNMGSTGSTLTFAATVTDAAQQAEAGSAVIPLTEGPMLIDVVGEFGQVIPGIDNRVFVIVTDPAGRPLVADVAIAADGAELAQVRTGEDGVAEVSVQPASSGLRLTLTATDDAEREYTRVVAIGSEAGDEHLALRAEQALFGPGETVRLALLGDAGIERAYVDVYQGARGVHSQSVELEDGAGELTFTVDYDMRGIVFVDAFAFGSDGEPLRASRRLLIEGGDRLQVELSSDAESYAPGEEASVTVEVKDASGQPQVASIGLTVVNEASFQLGGEPRTDLVRHFSFDPATLPGDLSVLDLNAGSLFSGTRESRERAADLLLSRAGKAEVPVFYYDALPAEQPQVAASVGDFVQAETQQFLSSLARAVGSDGAEADDLNMTAQKLAAARLDPFGQPYRLVQRTGLFTLSFTSAGPDEAFETDDDATREVGYSHLLASRVEAARSGSAFGAQSGGAGTGGAAPPGFGFGAPAAPAAGGDFGNTQTDPMPVGEPTGNTAPSGPTVRKDFRETVYNNPVLITDGSGRASVSFPLAHAITSWRVSAEGSTRDGKLGRARHGFRTFQSFFVDFDVPTRLTKGDVIKLPAVVYNYLADPVTVAVSLQSDSFFEIVGAASQQLSLGPSEVRAATFEVRITAAGEHQFTLVGQAGDKQDAIARTARIDPDGEPDDLGFSDKLGATAHSYNVALPVDTVAGGGFLTLSLTPGFAAEAVSGLENMVQEPNGCFEQTTSSAWPNTLIAHYLEQTGQLPPEKMEQIQGTVTRGYQRLLTFESPTGGFNWWGDSEPGNRILSAIMLWHLKDLEELIEIDEAVRDRTLSWLLEQQAADGSWPSGDALHAGNEVLGTSVTRTTAFIAWALAHTGLAQDAVTSAVDYLRAHEPPMTDLYANALSANALALVDPAHASTADLFARLEEMKELDGDGRISWPTETPSWTGAGGGAAAIETTGLVAYGLVKAGLYPASAAGAVDYLIANKDSVGSWYSTQATMNALRALGAAAGAGGNDAEGELQVRVNGTLAQTIPISADTNDLHREFDLSAYLVTGSNTVELSYDGSDEVAYTLLRRAYRPAPPPSLGPLDLDVQYDRTDVNVGDTITADVTVSNNDLETRNQVIARVGIAPGMDANLDDLAGLVRDGKVSRYELRDKEIVLYCMNMLPGEARAMQLRMTATLAAEATAAGSTVYAYYEPTLKRVLPAVRFTVR